MKKIILNIVYGVLFYTIISIVSLSILLFVFSEEIIGNFSNFIFNTCFVIIPTLIYILPLILKFVFEIKFSKALTYSLIIYLLSLTANIFIRKSIITYISDFTHANWQNYANLRYLMLESFEEKYHVIGMPKEEVLKLLGDDTEDVGNLENRICYSIANNFPDYIEYYCLSYDDNDIITNTKKEVER